MIPRKRRVETLRERLRSYPVVAVLGPRQVGKTTLAKQIAHSDEGPVSWLDLERPADLNRLADDPELVLGALQGLIVL